jgi:hypothetical protein
MANKSPSGRETKKPKKDAKISAATKEAPVPMVVEVIHKKRKDKSE